MGRGKRSDEEQRLISFNILEDDAGISRGRELFHGKIANCVGCHGVDGSGGVATLDYDDWLRNTLRGWGFPQTTKMLCKRFERLGAHRPRPIYPRNRRMEFFAVETILFACFN